MTKKTVLKLTLIVSTLTLAACSSNMMTSQSSNRHQYANNGQVGGTAEKPVATGSAPGGSLANQMDTTDKSKMYHALDNAPGKSTMWANANTGITYTVIPVKKVTLNGNPYCRVYETTAEKDGQQHQTSGTACIGQDGEWHSV